MEIVVERPPVYDLICNNIGLPPHGTIFTYGGYIYNPDGVDIPEALIEHEKVHMKQQDRFADVWWRRYIADPWWRAQQEAEAYAVQYKAMAATLTSRPERRHAFASVARSLSSATYGNCVSFAKAKELIRYAKA